MSTGVDAHAARALDVGLVRVADVHRVALAQRSSRPARARKMPAVRLLEADTGAERERLEVARQLEVVDQLRRRPTRSC